VKRKPLTVWIVQGFAVVVAVLLLLAFILNLRENVAIWAAKGNWVLPVLSSALMFSIVFFLLAIMFIGLLKRKQYGRWMSVGFLLVWWFAMLVSNPNPFRYKQVSDDGPLPTFKISESEKSGARAGQLMLHLFVLAMILQLIFARSVRDYFKLESLPDTRNQTAAGPTHQM
jgi:hypothetical protein